MNRRMPWPASSECSEVWSACSRDENIRLCCSSTICSGWTRERWTCWRAWSSSPTGLHLLLIGAYRDNEVGPTHPLARTLSAVRASEAAISEIALAPLTVGHVAQLCADALHTDLDRVAPLAELIADKTGGNPFFAIQFILTLADERLLTFDPVGLAWQWDIERIRAKGITDNVADLMATKLSRLQPATREALGQLACLGNLSQIGTAAQVRQSSEEEVHSVLREAVEGGLVLRTSRSFAFAHDRVHEAAYALVPARDRAATHLQIGRTLIAVTSGRDLDERIFEIVSQFARGLPAIESDQGARIRRRAVPGCGSPREGIERLRVGTGLFLGGPDAARRARVDTPLRADARARIELRRVRNHRRRARDRRRTADATRAARHCTVRSGAGGMSVGSGVLHDWPQRASGRSRAGISCEGRDRVVDSTWRSRGAGRVCEDASAARATADRLADRPAGDDRSQLHRHHGGAHRALSSGIRGRSISAGVGAAAHDHAEPRVRSRRELQRRLLRPEHGTRLALQRLRDGVPSGRAGVRARRSAWHRTLQSARVFVLRRVHDAVVQAPAAVPAADDPRVRDRPVERRHGVRVVQLAEL